MNSLNKLFFILVLLFSGSSYAASTHPGGTNGQLQYNNNGNFGGFTSSLFFVTTYGAKCDAQILYSGVQTTNGSHNVTSPVYTFTSADVGATFDITAPAPLNGHNTSPPTAWTGTISSVSAGNAVMSSTAPFTSTGYAFADLRWYHTDDTLAIQAAINAAEAMGAGTIIFPRICATGALTFYSNQDLVGINQAGSGVMLKNGANSDLFISYQFASLVGSNSNWGVGDNHFSNILIDGNRGANTGSGQGTGAGVGSGIRIYGWEFNLDHVLINNFAGDGMYTEWSTDAGTPCDSSSGNCLNAAPDGMETHINDTKFFNNAGYNLVYNGPHDSRISYVYSLGAGLGGILNALPNGSPLIISHFHGYAEGGYDLDLEQPNTQVLDSVAEDGVLVNAANEVFRNVQIGYITSQPLTLGKLGGTPNSVYDNVFEEVSAFGIVNNLDTGNDFWVRGGTGGSVTGGYAPYGLNLGTVGLGSQNFGNGATMNLFTGSSWPWLFAMSSASEGTIKNGGVNVLVSESDGRFSMGPSAATPGTNVGLDLSAFNSAANSALVLPGSTTTNRPTTPTPGMIRYNSTIPGVEAYYNGTWNTLR